MRLTVASRRGRQPPCRRLGGDGLCAEDGDAWAIARARALGGGVAVCATAFQVGQHVPGAPRNACPPPEEAARGTRSGAPYVAPVPGPGPDPSTGTGRPAMSRPIWGTRLVHGQS